MRAHRILAALAATLIAVTGTMLIATPAYAGNWAVTVLDPVPDRWEAAKGYTVGMWVLQHGYHPYEGDLGDVALRLVDGDGAALTFPAVALPEPAHYAAAIAVPHTGTWAVIGVQGRFADYHIGTLTVPGQLSVLGVPAPLQPSAVDRFWPGAIRPPSVAVDEARDPFAPVAGASLDPDGATAAPAAPAPVTSAPVTSATADASPAVRTLLTLAIWIGIGIMVAIAAALAMRRRWWQRRHQPAPNVCREKPARYRRMTS